MANQVAPMIIGIDFDGTIVASAYPDTGRPLPGAIATLRDLVACGHRLILWTVRAGPDLGPALSLLDEHGIELWGINQNPEQQLWGTPAAPEHTDGGSPKAHCHMYIDDRALGVPLDEDGHVDWTVVRRALIDRGAL